MSDLATIADAERIAPVAAVDLLQHTQTTETQPNQDPT
jgi:hypothetical protein